MFISKSHAQWIAAFGTYVLLFQIGIIVGWASPNVTRYTHPDSKIPLTPHEASWLVSILTLGGIAGAIIGSVTNEYLGSRKTVITAFIFIIVQWAAIIAANSVEWLYFARTMGGIACAVTYTSFSIYLAEVTRSEVRGTLVSVASSGSPLGIVLGTVAESYLPPELSCAAYLLVALAGISTMLYLPDSPYYLLKKSEEKAERAVAMYYYPCDPQKKLAEIEAYVRSEVTPKTLQDKLREFREPAVKKAFVLVVVLFCLPHLAGEVAVMSYLEMIVRRSGSLFIEPKQFVIYAHLIGISASFLTVNLIDKFGRRVMLMFSSLGVALSLAILGLYFFELHSGAIGASFPHWLPFANVAMFRITHASGFLQIPSTVIGEILPENVKSLAVCMATLAGSTVAFFTALIYQKVVDLGGEESILWIYSGLALTAIPFALIFLPETKGKSLAEIQELLKK